MWGCQLDQTTASRLTPRFESTEAEPDCRTACYVIISLHHLQWSLFPLTFISDTDGRGCVPMCRFLSFINRRIIRKWQCYIQYKLFFKEKKMILAMRTVMCVLKNYTTPCIVVRKKKKKAYHQSHLLMFVWKVEFSLLSGLWCLILMFSVKQKCIVRDD